MLLNLDNYRHEHSQIWYNVTVTWSFKYQYKDDTVIMSVCIHTHTHAGCLWFLLVFVHVRLMGNNLKILCQEILMVSNWPCWETWVVHQFKCLHSWASCCVCVGGGVCGRGHMWVYTYISMKNTHTHTYTWSWARAHTHIEILACIILYAIYKPHKYVVFKQLYQYNYWNEIYQRRHFWCIATRHCMNQGECVLLLRQYLIIYTNCSFMVKQQRY
jgi:hypothetical protein